ncbi:helix-turn-helix transcriptional regulator [Neorhizobium sp. JUb45]|uniref:helix-turn-helix transcriptional regulator n=1 Tax=unclassified Neorhizobium TaxID=2629175 RepID=UPI0010E67C5B|nr:helix-turn-helix transcriptional regulator [Neorhizobium sp. JUb45]TCR03131.1 helix-turn-helix protein [Neorhizobium sp. JUb45]
MAGKKMTGTDWKDLRAELPQDVRAELDAKREARRMGNALAELRKATGLTQQELAQKAAMTQNTISKIEHADDVLVSSIVRYVHSMGGSVELVLKTPDGNTQRVDFDPRVYIRRSDKP